MECRLPSNANLQGGQIIDFAQKCKILSSYPLARDVTIGMMDSLRLDIIWNHGTICVRHDGQCGLRNEWCAQLVNRID